MRTVNYPGYEQSLRSRKVEQKNTRASGKIAGCVETWRVCVGITLAAGHASVWQAISALASVFFFPFFFLPDFPWVEKGDCSSSTYYLCVSSANGKLYTTSNSIFPPFSSWKLPEDGQSFPNMQRISWDTCYALTFCCLLPPAALLHKFDVNNI